MSSQDLDTWLGSPSIYVSHLRHGRGATLLRGLMNHGPWLLTTYETWDDPPSTGYGALVKSELSNNIFFSEGRTKIRRSRGEGERCTSDVCWVSGTSKKGLAKVMTHMLHILWNIYVHLAEIYGACISKYSSPDLRRIWLMIIWWSVTVSSWVSCHFIPWEPTTFIFSGVITYILGA